jgi:hypothetical protein
MSDRDWDPNDEVPGALRRIVQIQGKEALSKSDDQTESNFMGIVSDQLGDLPAKSRELLKQAVDSGVAAELEQRIRAGMDSDSAVQSVASWLITTTPNDAEGCTWVTREFARALGYETTFRAAPAEETGESATMGEAATQMAGSPYRPGDQATVGGAPIRQPQILPAAREARSRNVPIAAASVAAVVAVVAIVVLTHKSPTPSPPSTTTTTAPPTTTTTTTTLPVTASLAKLLPSDVDPSNCSATNPPTGFQGDVDSVACSPSNLSGGSLYAFQFDSGADYETSFNAFNTDVNFSASGSDCEGSYTSASVSWSNQSYPNTNGQMLECYYTSSGNEPVYLWTIPSQDAIMEAVGGSGSTIGDLYSWWKQYGGPFN